MKKSIKWRITFNFLTIITCCLLSILICNTIFLEKVYIHNRTQVLKKAYETLDAGVIDAYNKGYTLDTLFSNNSNSPNSKKINRSNFYTSIESSLSSFLRQLQEAYNINIVLVDSDNNTYSLYPMPFRNDNKVLNYIFGNYDTNENIIKIEENQNYKLVMNNNVVGHRSNNNDNKNGTLECFGFLTDNQTAFLMTTPIMSMKEPINLFNNFLIILAIFTLIIGAVIIYFYSYNLTTPIIDLANISKKMSNLDFDTKYKGDRTDEIGILGNSINEMSNKLEKTIKELKNANVQLKTDIEQKEKLDLMRREFIANVSHELKTPIALIQGYAEGLQSGIAEKKEDRDYYLDVIVDETNKMNKMVRQLLELSSLEKEVDDIEITRFNLYDVAAQVCKNQSILLEQKQINLNIDIDNKISVWADEFKIEEVITNYLTNAINHVDENKLIKIFVEKINDDTVRLNVYNSGEQLSSDNLLNVWEKFYKTDKARTRSYGGIGLGLSIVKAIALKHNTNYGCINVNEDKQLKKGVIFYFDLSTK